MQTAGMQMHQEISSADEEEKMFETLKRMDKKGMLTEAMIAKAVKLNWITEDEAQQLRT